MPTGLLALDKQTGGGYPIGRMVEVAGWEGSGKSTVIDQGIAEWQRNGGVANLIDSGEGRDISYTRTLGVQTDKLITSEVETIEEAFDAMEKIIAVQEKKTLALEKSKVLPPPVLIAWDALGGTPSRAELEGNPSDDHVAVAARVIALNFKRMISRMARLRITLLFANHFYKTIGSMSTLVSYGGKGPRYYTALRLWIRKMNEVRIGGNVVGFEMESKIRKTKISRWQPPDALGMIHGAGLDNAWTLYRWGKANGIGGDYPDHKWIVQSGAWCYLVPPGHETITFQRSFLGLGEVLAENPEIYQEFVAAYMADGNAETS